MRISSLLPPLRVSWKVFFALAAFIEVLYVTLLMQQNSNSINDSKYDEVCPSAITLDEDEFSINYTFIDRAFESIVKTTIVRNTDLTLFFWIGPAFVALCLVEA